MTMSTRALFDAIRSVLLGPGAPAAGRAEPAIVAVGIEGYEVLRLGAAQTVAPGVGFVFGDKRVDVRRKIVMGAQGFVGLLFVLFGGGGIRNLGVFRFLNPALFFALVFVFAVFQEANAEGTELQAAPDAKCVCQGQTEIPGAGLTSDSAEKLQNVDAEHIHAPLTFYQFLNVMILLCLAKMIRAITHDYPIERDIAKIRECLEAHQSIDGQGSETKGEK